MAISSHSYLEVILRGHSHLEGMVLGSLSYGYIFTQLPGGKFYLRSPYLIIISLLLALFATFQKAGTCLDDQQSMAKQPIKG